MNVAAAACSEPRGRCKGKYSQVRCRCVVHFNPLIEREVAHPAVCITERLGHHHRVIYDELPAPDDYGSTGGASGIAAGVDQRKIIDINLTAAKKHGPTAAEAIEICGSDHR